MGKVLVDTCFIEKFKNGIHLSPDFMLLVGGLGYTPIVHEFILMTELDTAPYKDDLLSLDNVETIGFADVIENEIARILYISQYVDIYNLFVDRLEIIGSKKYNYMQKITTDYDIFSARKQGSSFADVHIVLTALYCNIPIILTEDSDMSIIYNIAKGFFESSVFELNTYRAYQLVFELAKKDAEIEKKELERILDNLGERSHRSELRALLKKSRNNDIKK